MTNKEFKDELDRLLRPSGFRKKGNTWRSENNEIEKVIELQKSDYSNLYYLNYGYNFKNLHYHQVSMHIFKRFGYVDKLRNEESQDTLDLEKPIAMEKRITKLKNIVDDLLNEILNTNTPDDIKSQLATWITLNGVPIKVKEFLKL
jgi:hypothetical protein